MSDSRRRGGRVAGGRRAYWREFGRNYYCRYDYEGVDKGAALRLTARLTGLCDMFALAGGAGGGCAGVVPGEAAKAAGMALAACDEFEYEDPVDGSVASRQGWRFVFADGSRVVFRLSGTGSVGATIRLYLEKYEAPGGEGSEARLAQAAADALAPLVAIALELSRMEHYTGRTEPTVIT